MPVIWTSRNAGCLRSSRARKLGNGPSVGRDLARPRSTCVYAAAWRTLPRLLGETRKSTSGRQVRCAAVRWDLAASSYSDPKPATAARPIDVSLASPDLIALRDVTPLLVRNLTACRRHKAFRAIAAFDCRNYMPRCHQMVGDGARAERDNHPAAGQRNMSCARQAARASYRTGDHTFLPSRRSQGSHPEI